MSDIEINTIFDSSTCVRKGSCPVTSIRGQNEDPLEKHSLYFEQHGTGPEKILFIMGMNNPSVFWEDQVNFFGSSSQYSVLVFDNRGVGHSSTPKGPYTTKGMAEDTVCLLDYIDWTKERDLHVVGTSLGGMIALEMATIIPKRLASLTLMATTAGGLFWNNFPSWRAMLAIPRVFLLKDDYTKLQIILTMLFPKSWLNEKMATDKQGRKNFEIQTESYMRRRKASPLQSPAAEVAQMRAALGHFVSSSRLLSISKAVPKILILSGDEDYMVDPSKSHYLKDNMPEAEYIQWKNTGHVLHIQWPERFHKLLERIIKEGRDRCRLQT